MFSWDDVLKKLLTSYINGIVCVIRTNIGQSYTLFVNGDDISVIGKGDLHDPLYDSMIYTVDGSVEELEDGKLGVVENLITYRLEIYPSLKFETQYITNSPDIYTTIVAMTFLATSRIFLLYDLSVKYKHNVIVLTAVHYARILDSFFPADFGIGYFNG